VSWFTGILVYVVIWWIVIFMVLPWGVRRTEEPKPGHDAGAPANPMLWRKALITTVIAAVVWGIAYYLIDSELLSLRGP
jgi:predicted secreted protein